MLPAPGRDYKNKALLTASKDTQNSAGEYWPPRKDIARGILPSIRHIFKREHSLDKSSTRHAANEEGVSVFSIPTPDSHANPFSHPIDPHGNDFFCKICLQELSNTYFHCEGCEELLQKSFDICSQCFAGLDFLVSQSMSGDDSGLHWVSDFHHVGDTMGHLESNECGCHAGPCLSCPLPVEDGAEPKYLCKMCSCNCHKKFSRRHRFYRDQDFDKIVLRCEALVDDEEVPLALETEARLDGVRLLRCNDPRCDKETRTVLLAQKEDHSLLGSESSLGQNRSNNTTASGDPKAYHWTSNEPSVADTRHESHLHARNRSEQPSQFGEQKSFEKNAAQIHQLLTNELWKDDPVAVKEGLTELCHLTKSSNENIEQFWTLGSLTNIVGPMKKWAANEDVQRVACVCLRNALGSNSDAAEARADSVLETHAMEAVLGSMIKFKGSADLHDVAIGALSNMVATQRSAKHFVMNLHGHDAVVDAMQKFADDAVLQKWACALLSNLSDFDCLVAYLETSGARKALYNAIDTHVDPNNIHTTEIHMYGKDALKRLL
jgi:hypothetical protein